MISRAFHFISPFILLIFMITSPFDVFAAFIFSTPPQRARVARRRSDYARDARAMRRASAADAREFARLLRFARAADFRHYFFFHATLFRDAFSRRRH